MANDSTQALDIYAKAEDLLGVKDAAPKLYEYYIDALKQLKFKSLIDVGCGGGDFLLNVDIEFNQIELFGIDLSLEMVKKSRKKGLNVECIDICKIDKKFDVITCVYDMLNYLSPDDLRLFMKCVTKILNPDGYLICDINTKYGFEEIAVGAYSANDDKRFISIDSDFKDGIYTSEFTLFEKNYVNCWRHSKGIIKQYYHSPEDISQDNLALIHSLPLYIFGDEPDKEFLIFQKV